MKLKLLYGLTAYGIADPIGTIVTVNDDTLSKTLLKAGLVTEVPTTAPVTPKEEPQAKNDAKKKK